MPNKRYIDKNLKSLEREREGEQKGERERKREVTNFITFIRYNRSSLFDKSVLSLSPYKDTVPLSCNLIFIIQSLYWQKKWGKRKEKERRDKNEWVRGDIEKMVKEKGITCKFVIHVHVWLKNETSCTWCIKQIKIMFPKLQFILKLL